MALGGIYENGTVTIEANRLSVVGVDTFWSPIVEVGDWILIAGQVGMVGAVIDETHLTLESQWQGTLPSGAVYVIIKMSWLRYDPALTQAKVRQLLEELEAQGNFLFVEGPAPDPGMGEDGQWALKTDVSPWQLWFKENGSWISQTSPAGLAWKGTWSAATSYAATDAVEHLGASYVSKQANNLNHPPPDATWWDLLAAQGAAGATGATGPEGLNWRGNWSSTDSYAIDDAVARTGNSFIATTAHTSGGAGPPGTGWDLLAQGGSSVDTALPYTWTGPHAFQNTISITSPEGPFKSLWLTQTGDQAGTVAGDISNATGGNPALAYNQIYITAEGANVTGPTDPKFTYGTNIYMVTGGTNSSGGKVSLNVGLYKSAASNPSPSRDHIALNVLGLVDFGDGGTGTALGQSNGTMFGMGLQSTARSGATNLFEVAGAEIDVGIATGASATYRFGLSTVCTHQVQGVVEDAAYEIGSASGPGWRSGILFGGFHGSPPMSSNGTVIDSDGSPVTCLNFADFSNWTFTGDIFKFKNFRVSGAGQVAGGAPFDALGTMNIVVDGWAQSNQRVVGALGLVNNAAPVYFSDMWCAYLNGAALPVAVLNVTNNSTVSAQSNSWLQIYNNSAGAINFTGNDFALVFQRIEGYRWARLNWWGGAGVPVTISFIAYPTGAPTTLAVSLLNGAQNRSYVVDVPLSAGPNLYTVTIPRDSAGASVANWPIDHTTGAVLAFCVGAGPSAKTAPPNTWNAGAYYATPNTGNCLAAAGTAVYISGVHVCAGSPALPLSGIANHRNLQLPLGDELKTIYRYLYQTKSKTGIIANGQASSATAAIILLPLPTGMRVSPTLTLSAPAHFSLLSASAGILPVTSLDNGLGAAGNSSIQINVSASGGGLVAGDTTGLTCLNVNTGTVAVDARL